MSVLEGDSGMNDDDFTAYATTGVSAWKNACGGITLTPQEEADDTVIAITKDDARRLALWILSETGSD